MQQFRAVLYELIYRNGVCQWEVRAASESENRDKAVGGMALLAGAVIPELRNQMVERMNGHAVKLATD